MAGPVPTALLRSDLKAEVKEKLRQSYGTELAGTANQFLIGDLFQHQAKPWKELAKMHMLNVWEAARYFVLLALRHLAASHTYASILRTIVAPELDILNRSCSKSLMNLLRT
jgi:hypothetical protein